MIDPEKRKAIYFLYVQGMALMEISQQMHVDRDTARTIIELKGEMPDSKRSDKIELDGQLLIRLYVPPPMMHEPTPQR